MSYVTMTGLLLLGMLAGYFSGLIGIGGGIIIVPALVMFFGFSQHLAQGTTLVMMIPPVGILAAMTYYQKGMVDLKIAGFLCVGFILGGYFGGKFATILTPGALRKLFSIVLIIIALRLLFYEK
jgi:uncharacterized membrane protein YfcA